MHGSAPDIAGKGIANPIAMIASFGMALRYSFDMGREADLIDRAIAAVLAKGLRTADIMSDGANAVGTAEMGDAMIAELDDACGLIRGTRGSDWPDQSMRVRWPGVVASPPGEIGRPAGLVRVDAPACRRRASG